MGFTVSVERLCSIIPWTPREGFLISQVKKKKTLELTKEILKNIHLFEDEQPLFLI